MKQHWLMMRQNTGTLWITSGKRTFEETDDRFLSQPVFPLTQQQADDYYALWELRKGMKS